MTMRNAIAALIFAVPCALGFSSAASAQQAITIASWGGAYAKSQRETYFEPFSEKYDVQITDVVWDDDVNAIQRQVLSGEYQWDIVDAQQDTVLDGCDLGILDPIDYGLMGGREAFLEGAALDCGVGTVSWSTIFAYNAETLKGTPPTKIADFFDLEAFPGKRGLYRSPKVALEWALMADGVPKEQIYGQLATSKGLDQAFKKLDTIKSEIVWWTDPAEPAKLLIDGTVVMTAGWNGRIYDAAQAKHKDLAIVWDAQGLEFDYWAIPKGAPNTSLAMRFIAFASQPEIQKNQSKFIPYGPATYAAAALIPPEIHKNLPTATANSQNVLVVNNRFWARYGAELNKRFQAWIAN
ncbi:MAG: ABC transporter substrate-binding protein [Rhodospirillaceae bacterium]|jgi:putative spermidine/putrescine transport system substrate-binding protein|nr:ABC transporter substrate-binding protein [Rhodospirillaceae bacterium]MBT6118498.1 ABC transporter substrate-binding protein [Rhodospirillaceae bacterium]